MENETEAEKPDIKFLLLLTVVVLLIFILSITIGTVLAYVVCLIFNINFMLVEQLLSILCGIAGLYIVKGLIAIISKSIQSSNGDNN